MNAEDFEGRYGAYVRRHFGGHATAHKLRVGLAARYPFAKVSEGMLKVWVKKYRVLPGAVKVSSVAELVDELGADLEGYSQRYPSAFKLARALEQREPPVCVTDAAAKTWFKRYRGDLREYFHAQLGRARARGILEPSSISEETEEE